MPVHHIPCDIVAADYLDDIRPMPESFNPPFVERDDRVECDLFLIGFCKSGNAAQDAALHDTLRAAVWHQIEAERLGIADEVTYAGRA